MRKHRLDKVGMVAKGKVDVAANRLRDALRSEQAEQTRLDQLTEFSREYDQFLERRDADTLSPRQLEEYRRFMHRLHVAVDSQSQSAATSSKAVAACSGEWQQASLRERALKNLITQQNTQADREEEKRQQTKLESNWRRNPELEG
jgi:flagellar export protein FliJ